MKWSEAVDSIAIPPNLPKSGQLVSCSTALTIEIEVHETSIIYSVPFLSQTQKAMTFEHGDAQRKAVKLARAPYESEEFHPAVSSVSLWRPYPSISVVIAHN